MRTLAKLALAYLVAASSVAWAVEPPPAPESTPQATAATPNLDNGKQVYRTCAVCHTPEGWGSESGNYPQIAGQHISVLIKQLSDIRGRNRDNPTMRPFTSPRLLGGSQEIADVAAYVAALPMNPHNSVGAGNDLALGEQLYKEHCVECHGDQGQGNPDARIPRIQGQHYPYLLRQFEWIRTGKRRNADERMIRQIQGFSTRGIQAVLDYASRLRPPADRLAPPGWQNPDFPQFSRQDLGNTPLAPPLPPVHTPMPPPQTAISHPPETQNKTPRASGTSCFRRLLAPALEP